MLNVRSLGFLSWKTDDILKALMIKSLINAEVDMTNIVIIIIISFEQHVENVKYKYMD